MYMWESSSVCKHDICIMKKVDILSKEVNETKKNGIKAKKNVGLKKAYFWGTQYSGSWSQSAWTYLQNIRIFTNISTLKKSAISRPYVLR